MTQRDFNFWLQGLFELADSKVVLSVRQLGLIRDHLDLVASLGAVSPFGAWLKGSLDTLTATGVLDLEPGTKVDANLSSMIEERLQIEFKPVVERSPKIPEKT